MRVALTASDLQGSEIVKIFPLPYLLAKSSIRPIVPILIGLCLVIFAIFIEDIPSLCAPTDRQEAKTVSIKQKSASIRITGSMCPSCLKHLAEKLKRIDGVTDANINLLPAPPVRLSLKSERHPHYRKALVLVDFQPEKTDTGQIVEAIKENDFGVLSVSCHKHPQSSQIVPSKN
jgi:copper chaperone CopZ